MNDNVQHKMRKVSYFYFTSLHSFGSTCACALHVALLVLRKHWEDFFEVRIEQILFFLKNIYFFTLLLLKNHFSNCWKILFFKILVIFKKYYFLKSINLNIFNFRFLQFLIFFVGFKSYKLLKINFNLKRIIFVFSVCISFYFILSHLIFLIAHLPFMHYANKITSFSFLKIYLQSLSHIFMHTFLYTQIIFMQLKREVKLKKEKCEDKCSAYTADDLNCIKQHKM